MSVDIPVPVADEVLGLSPAAGGPGPDTGPNGEANGNGNNDKEKEQEQEITLADNSQKTDLRQRPLFDLFAGGIAGQNMVCK